VVLPALLQAGLLQDALQDHLVPIGLGL
jgi:hypothetical protein